MPAEVFGSELEQANELLAAGYASAAAVAAGVFLETTIRNLCIDHEIEHGKLDKMNADWPKCGFPSPATDHLEQKVSLNELLDELLEVKGIGKAILDKNREKLEVN
ncbi:hypothetical protein ACYZT7_10720 [Pseudomonas sp. RT4P38]